MKNNLRQFLFGTSLNENNTLNIGWLLFRVHVGLSIAIHAGWPKMNAISAPGWFTDQVAGIGFTFPSPEFWAATASWGEFVGGLLIAVFILYQITLKLNFIFLYHFIFFFVLRLFLKG